jgi:hypothetical protein
VCREALPEAEQTVDALEARAHLCGLRALLSWGAQVQLELSWSSAGAQLGRHGTRCARHARGWYAYNVQRTTTYVQYAGGWYA